MFASFHILYVLYNFIHPYVLTIFIQLSSQYEPFFNIILTFFVQSSL